jgi:hypothetical protein
MTLPVFEKTYTIQHWSNIFASLTAANRGFIWKIKDLLVNSGHWSVIASSDGSTYSWGSDLWVTEYTVPSNSWIVLENTVLGSSGKFQICLQASTTTVDQGARATLNISPSGTYSNSGSISGSTRPPSTDEINILSNALIFNSNDQSTVGRRLELWSSSDGKHFIFIGCKGSSCEVSSNTIWCLSTVKNARSEWTDNWVSFYGNPVISGVSAGTPSIKAYYNSQVLTDLRMMAEGNTSGWLVEQTHYQTVDANGDYSIQPALYYGSEAISAGVMGQPIDWYFISSSLAIGTELPSSGAVTHIVYNNLVLPWDDTDPVLI